MGPMTSKQAQHKHECEMCKTKGGGACGAEHGDSYDCVLDRTCSIRCKYCRQMVYFDGNLQHQRKVFICPYDDCGEKQHSEHLGETYVVKVKLDNSTSMRRKPYYFVESRFGEAMSENMTATQMQLVRKALQDLGIIVMYHTTENHIR